MLYTDIERTLVSRFKAAVPPIDYGQRGQFAMSLPLLALFSAVLTAILGGWLSTVISVLGVALSAPSSITVFLLSPFFWLALLPPILWAVSYFPLRERRRRGWRLFTWATILALVSSLVSFSLIGILFSGAILYFTLLSYEEFWR